MILARTPPKNLKNKSQAAESVALTVDTKVSALSSLYISVLFRYVHLIHLFLISEFLQRNFSQFLCPSLCKYPGNFGTDVEPPITVFLGALFMLVLEYGFLTRFHRNFRECPIYR